jgi:ferritin-like metal-binding protein YciE
MKSTTLQPSANAVENKEAIKANNRITEGLFTLFLDGLKDINWAEKALARALPKMVKNTTSDTLTSALSRHLEMTQGHIIQLESIFCAIDEKVKSKKCPIMASLIREAEKTVDDAEKGMVRDAVLVSINRKIRHHEMATYSVLHSLAITLLEHDAAVLLRQNFEEEKEADEQLAAIAKSFLSADIKTSYNGINGKKTNGIATNKALAKHQKGIDSAVLEAYLPKSEATNIKVLRIIEVQYENKNNSDLTTLTRAYPEGPLSINVNFDAFSQ